MSDLFAAVDLGSNSFRLLIARRRRGGFEEVEHERDVVRLRSGLDGSGALTEAAMDRALGTLAHFGRLLKKHAPEKVRAVATNTFRVARNGGELARRGAALLGYPIEIIEGGEEARLIYRAIAEEFSASKRGLVAVDIGGGSTELMLGQPGGDFDHGVSLEMGCISWTQRFFPGGELSAEAFDAAVREAQVEVDRVAPSFIAKEIRHVGSSGTIRNVWRVLRSEEWISERISIKGMGRLVQEIRGASSVEALELEGLKDTRAPIFPGGVAILLAVLRGLFIEKMEFSKTALREGVLIDLSSKSRRGA